MHRSTQNINHPVACVAGPNLYYRKKEDQKIVEALRRNKEHVLKMF
jgi:hypothetical protein